MRSKQRTAPDYGGKAGYGFFFFVIKHLGLWPAYFCLNFVIPYYIILRPAVRKSARYYLQKRFPEDSSLRLLLRTVKYLNEFARVLVDQAATGILGTEKLKVEFPESEKFYALAKGQESIVLLTSHFGFWQTAMAKMEEFPKPINFLLQVDKHMQGRHFFDLTGDKEKIKFIDPTGFMGGLIEATEALQRGECVSIMGDRVMGWRSSKSKFWGREASFPLTPHHLAVSTSSRLIMFMTLRTGTMSFRIKAIDLSREIEYSGSADKKAVMQRYMDLYAHYLEEFTEQDPYMWFNFFDFWK